MKFLIILGFLLSGVLSLEFDRPCRTEVKAKENMLRPAYTGIWYEIQRTDDLGADCTRHFYTQALNGTAFNIDREGIVDGETRRENGTAVFADPNDDALAIFNATITRSDDGLEHEYRYQIVHSDYSNYAITWSCEDLEDGRSREEGILLGRTTSFTNFVNAQINFFLSEIGLEREDFRDIDHSFETCILMK